LPPVPALDRRMREALDLARGATFRVEPNPAVGAVVLAADGEIAGRGRTEPYGGRHAEIVALEEAGERARGGTLVVTLEPCAHDEGKKTPPCTPAVIRSGVARVVVGCADPNPATTGRARPALESAGIEVEEGVLEEDCRAGIARFAEHLGEDVPWTIAKWAMSADGRIADQFRHSRWITGAAARALVHEIRGHVEAVAVGVGTVLADDPSLTCRTPGGRSGLRVVFDSSLRTPLDAQIVRTAGEVPTLLIGAEGQAEAGRVQALRSLGVEVLTVPAEGPHGRVDPRAALRELHRRGVRRLLLEAGGALTGRFLRGGLVHQVMAFVAPVVLGGDAAPSPFHGDGFPIESAPRLDEARTLPLGVDVLLEGYWPREAVE